MSARAVSAVIRKYAEHLADGGGVVWGSIDCLHFGLEAHHAAGNADLRPLLSSYDSPLSAFRALRSKGHLSLISALNANATPIPASSARVGDVAYLSSTGLGCIGVVVGGESLFLVDGGLVRRATAPLFIWRAR